MTKNRYASGVAAQAEVSQAEAQLKTTQHAADVGVQRARTEHAIALLLGEAASTFSLPKTLLVATPPSIPVRAPSELLERRPDIAVAEQRDMAAANAAIGITEAAYYPTIILSASRGFESTSLSQWLTWPMHFWSVGAGISQVVYDGGLRRDANRLCTSSIRGECRQLSPDCPDGISNRGGQSRGASNS